MAADLHLVDYGFWVNGVTRESGLPLSSVALDQAAPEIPKLSFLPLMQRRRLSSLGKIALSTLYPLFKQYSPAGDLDVAVVFASRWGDIALTVRSLEELSTEKSLSPTAFSTSVHNGIGGLFSLFTGFQGHVTSLAAAEHTISAALTEAQALLSEFPQVFVCLYDDRTPEVFKPYHEKAQPPFAVSLVLTSDSSVTGGKGAWVRLTPGRAVDHSEPLTDFLQFVAGKAPAFATRQATWRWRPTD